MLFMAVLVAADGHPVFVLLLAGISGALFAPYAPVLTADPSSRSWLLLLVPDSVGSAASGDSWSGIRHVLPWTIVEYVGICIATGAILGLKVRAQARPLIVQRLTRAVAMVVGATIAAFYVGDVSAGCGRSCGRGRRVGCYGVDPALEESAGIQSGA